MTTEQITMLVVGVVLFMGIIIAYLTKKDYLKYGQLIKPILQAISEVLAIVGGIFPNNMVITEMVTIIATSIKAAGYAEDLWLHGEINKTERPKYAQNYIEKLLNNIGIVVTDNIHSIISGVIAITCYLMPHYGAEEEQKEE